MSRCLLDTHAFLWFIMGDDSLGQGARKAIESPNNQIFVSLISLWEIGIKHSLGRLPLSKPFEILIPEQIQLNGFLSLPVEQKHINTMINLPWHHRDPFDRLLIAQAQCEDMSMVSKDRYFEAYDIDLVWN